VIGIALAGIAFGLVTFLVSARLIAYERREHAREAKQWERERAALLDRMAHLADKPWSPPPSRAPEPSTTPSRALDPDEELAVW